MFQVERLINLMSLLDNKLYKGYSIATYLLILNIVLAQQKNQQLTIKQLCSNPTKSALNVRQHVERLLKDGWIDISHDLEDKRRRMVIPTQQLIDLVLEAMKL